MSQAEDVVRIGLDDLHVSPATEKTPGKEEKAEPEPERTIMSNQGITLEEKLWVDECYLFQDEGLAPIFCKPKLIPLKTITTQKLEQMQKEQMEKLHVPAQPERTGTPETIESGSEKEENDQQGPSTSEPKKEADVWTADD
ncbi:unnamed protein product [Caenorhabditis nigoni]